MKKIITVIIATGFALVGAALAHSMVKSSNISSGDTFSSSPDSFEIEFSHEAGLADVTLETTDGDDVDIGFGGEDDMASEFSVDLPDLDSGDYLLTWRAVAMDGHVMSDTIDFTVE